MMEHGRTVQERDIGKGSWGSYAGNHVPMAPRPDLMPPI